jgi:hypothetical protein
LNENTMLVTIGAKTNSEERRHIGAGEDVGGLQR